MEVDSALSDRQVEQLVDELNLAPNLCPAQPPNLPVPTELTGQSLLRAERNSNECNWSTARKKIGPVNRPCDRPIDVISIASLIFLVTSRLADQRTKTHRPIESADWKMPRNNVTFATGGSGPNFCVSQREFFRVRKP
jgi:hypothetical protein